MGASSIKVSFPTELAALLQMPEKEIPLEFQRLVVVKLYELGKLSSGKAAKSLGISRADFLELAGKYQVSVFGNPSLNQLKQDLLNA